MTIATTTCAIHLLNACPNYIIRVGCIVISFQSLFGFQGKGQFDQLWINNSKKKISQNMQCLCIDTALVNQRVLQEHAIPKPTGLLVKNITDCFLCKSGKLLLCENSVQYFDFCASFVILYRLMSLFKETW